MQQNDNMQPEDEVKLGNTNMEEDFDDLESSDENQTFEDLHFEVGDALANLEFGKLLDLDRKLSGHDNPMAIPLSIMMWDTIIDIAQRRRAFKTKLIEGGDDLPVESYYMSNEMPYGKNPGYDVEKGSCDELILSLPYGDPEIIYEWSKLLDQNLRDKTMNHPRISITIRGRTGVMVASDLPVEYTVGWTN